MGFIDGYNYYMYEAVDPNVAHWALMGSPVPLLLITFSYLYFVLQCGPKFMEKRKAFSLDTYNRLYDLLQVVLNLGVVYTVNSTTWFSEGRYICGPLNHDADETALKLYNLAWWVLMLKILDYTETAVFVLRKKQRQITFLHVYHHISTVFLSWLTVKYYATGPALFFIYGNSGIHVMMYSYYFLSTFKTTRALVSPYKHFLTRMQMIQFVVFILFALHGYIPSCAVHPFVTTLMVINLVLNLYLFYNFYQNAYIKNKKN